jgi:hypothetical protein
MQPLLRRVVYTAATAAALPVVFLAWIVLAYGMSVVAILLIFMFSGGQGGSGDPVTRFLGGAFHFVGGAIAGAGVVALLNAMVEPRPFWMKTIAGAAMAGGIFAAMYPAAGPAMDTVAKSVIGSINDPGGRRQNEEMRAIAYAQDHEKVVAILGRNLKGGISSTRLQNDVALMYQVSLQGEKYGYAVLSVSHAAGKAEFSLVCVQFLGPDAGSPRITCAF